MTSALTLDRVVLGTVQIGLAYGRRSNAGVMADAEAVAILETAWALGIRRFDTAEAYGLSAARLSHWLKHSGKLEDAHVITKISATLPPSGVPASAAHALARFQGARTVTLLSHGAATSEAWPGLEAEARSVNARSGQSVYESAEVAAAWAQKGVQVVQAPANVFDPTNVLPPTDETREMHYRSVFLQGLLLDTPSVADARVPGSGRLARAVRDAANDVGLPAASLLVAGILGQSRPVDRVVLGADTPAELEPLAAAVAAPAEVVGEYRDVALAHA